MCLTCGCLLPHDDHGKVDYLTIEGLWKGANLDDLSLDEAVAMLIKTVEVAKKETEHFHRLGSSAASEDTFREFDK